MPPDWFMMTPQETDEFNLISFQLFLREQFHVFEYWLWLTKVARVSSMTGDQYSLPLQHYINVHGRQICTEMCVNLHHLIMSFRSNNHSIPFRILLCAQVCAETKPITRHSRIILKMMCAHDGVRLWARKRHTSVTQDGNFYRSAFATTKCIFNRINCRNNLMDNSLALTFARLRAQKVCDTQLKCSFFRDK